MMLINMGISELNLTNIIYIIVAFIGGASSMMYRMFSLISRLVILEQKIESIVQDQEQTKREVERIEDKLYTKLEAIDGKLDRFIIELYKKD